MNISLKIAKLRSAGLCTVSEEVEFKDPTKAVRITVIVFYSMLYVCC